MIRMIYLWVVLVILGISGCSKDDEQPEPPAEGIKKYAPIAVNKSNPINIYAHYMPWFETPETNDGNWGIHWTMSTKDPNITDDEGVREIASHYYPLIGPYASGDRDVIEYHLLLMKYAGIDGLIIDWYGSFDILDYDANRKNSEAVIGLLDEVGLGFAVTYEDRTLDEVVNRGMATSVFEAGKTDFGYLQDHYFSNEVYIDIGNKPLVTVFGPIVVQSPADWTSILGELNQAPTMLSLWGEKGDMGSNAAGEFAWVWQDNDALQNFYDTRIQNLDVALGSAYPGYNDYYTEGGWGEGQPWSIDHKNGLTLEETLNMSQEAGIDHLQLVTWNDFGEGTMIEPTREFGFDYLEKIRDFSGATFSGIEFEKIHKMYKLRKSKVNDPSAQKALTQAFYYFVSLQTDKAVAVVDSIGQLQ